MFVRVCYLFNVLLTLLFGVQPCVLLHVCLVFVPVPLYGTLGVKKNILRIPLPLSRIIYTSVTDTNTHAFTWFSIMDTFFDNIPTSSCALMWQKDVWCYDSEKSEW